MTVVQKKEADDLRHSADMETSRQQLHQLEGTLLFLSLVDLFRFLPVWFPESHCFHQPCISVHPYSALTLLVGRHEGLFKGGCWFVGDDILTELCTSYRSSCYHHLRHP